MPLKLVWADPPMVVRVRVNKYTIQIFWYSETYILVTKYEDNKGILGLSS